MSVNGSVGLSPPIVRPYLFMPFLQILKRLPQQYRYNELTLVLRIWVHLRQVRRGGGTHTSGVFGTLAPGSLAVECPACPHPGKNLVSPQVDR